MDLIQEPGNKKEVHHKRLNGVAYAPSKRGSPFPKIAQLIKKTTQKTFPQFDLKIKVVKQIACVLHVICKPLFGLARYI